MCISVANGVVVASYVKSVNFGARQSGRVIGRFRGRAWAPRQVQEPAGTNAITRQDESWSEHSSQRQCKGSSLLGHNKPAPASYFFQASGRCAAQRHRDMRAYGEKPAEEVDIDEGVAHHDLERTCRTRLLDHLQFFSDTYLSC